MGIAILRGAIGGVISVTGSMMFTPEVGMAMMVSYFFGMLVVW